MPSQTKQWPSIRLAFIIIAFLPSLTHGWTWWWTDDRGDTHIDNGTNDRKCTKMNLPKGKQYRWDSEGSMHCISLFSDDHCGDRNGWSCPPWGPRYQGQNVSLSYLVNMNGEEISSTPSSAEPTPTESSASTSNTSSPESTSPMTFIPTSPSTSTNTPIPPPVGSGKLSGGAIAGIVVGVIGLIAFVAFLCFISYRLGQRNPIVKASVEEPKGQSGGSGSPSAHEMHSPTQPSMAESQTMSTASSPLSPRSELADSGMFTKRQMLSMPQQPRATELPDNGRQEIAA
ncbi:hypothetical protein TRV_02100 [Trichophyton verrucosum HKI 0517]|uniref:Uncharacterized protein n=1 Tax=Trichophyton verrucosum (strain HKI 0517) TaxID=663202 RepID=D4D4T3_TRIVH|nr:uncharacterized protein TRV_02100 [Trichophyton verrucosum HKI 0517]EFE43139.1 hypothetical protein TRV_02100 [Trichophyton verrucosum HKI 0517]